MNVFKAFVMALVFGCALFFPAAVRAEDVPHVTTALFEEKVLNATTPVLVQFDAKWCPYCRRMQPVLQRFYEGDAAGMAVFKIDVDQEPMLADRFAVRTLPTLVILYKGEEIARNGGAMDADELKSWASSAAAKIK